MVAQLHHVSPLRTRLPAVQALVIQSSRSFGRHTHDQFGIGLLLQGGQSSHSCQGKVQAVPGNCITVHPDEVHDGIPLGDQPRCWFMLYMDPAVVAGVASAYEFARPVLNDARIRASMLAMHRTLASGAGDALLVEQECLRLLGRSAGSPAGKIEAPTRLRHARQLIDDACSTQLTLAELARAADMNKFELVRGFGRVFGLTPHAYLMQRRIQLARTLLASGASVIRAAADAGFADQSHLTRLFTRTLAITPAAYRRAFA